ncbi:hypothetical protein AVEN_27388-1 [Araneus ventricosus]|uniref:Uncharacterized protein n=1 Tax=Araneus ventricosus TaxID=182803 RepID=A0A4Y2NLV2_ARAVE|nr:hypothetical protein AVEN_27388-1 [Araneus ventricosus]
MGLLLVGTSDPSCQSWVQLPKKLAARFALFPRAGRIVVWNVYYGFVCGIVHVSEEVLREFEVVFGYCLEVKVFQDIVRKYQEEFVISLATLFWRLSSFLRCVFAAAPQTRLA